MAEAFGIAAGIVGLASLGVQLTDTIAKLKDARRIYQDAPHDVGALIAALEVLKRILTHICPPHQQLLTAQPQVQLLEDCKSWCQSIRNGIFDILQECRSDILSQPRLGKAKYVFRKGGIDQLLHRLQRAKLDLLLAHQIYGRQDMAYQLVDLHRELRLLQQSDLATLNRITSLDDRIDRMRDSMEDMTRWSRRIEQSMQAVESQAATALPCVQRTQAQVLSLTNKCDVMISQQGSLTRAYETRQIQRELSRFQGLLNDANLEQSAMCDELRRLDTRLDRFGEPYYARAPGGASAGESESTEFRCFLFSYKYQRSKPLPSGRAEAPRRNQEEAVWLNVHIPSWFVRDQWAISVLRATRGWQYTLRLYRVLPNSADVFSLCIRGDTDGLRASLLESGTSIYDQSTSGHTLLHVAAFAHQLAVCEFLVNEGINPCALSRTGDTPLHAMLYLMPSNPSVGHSLRLFDLLSSSSDTQAMTTNDSETARLLSTARNWTPEDQLLFVIKLYQPRRLVESRRTNSRTELARVRELRRDLECDKASTEELLRLHVPGPAAIYGISSLAAQIFLGQASMFGADLSSPWRALCIESLQAGYDPQLVPAYSDGWATMLGSSIRRLVNTLHKSQKRWDETSIVAQTCIHQWNIMMVEAGLNVDQVVSREHEAWVRSRKEYSRAWEHVSTPHDIHWMQFKDRIMLRINGNGALCAYPGASNTYWDLWDGDCNAKAPRNTVSDSSSSNIAGGDILAAHIPGSFPLDELDDPTKDTVERASTHSPADEHVMPKTPPLNHDDFPEGAADTHLWSDMQLVLTKSPEAEAYRRLRFGVPGLAHPSRHDGGHGVSCSCTRCTMERTKIRADIETEYRAIYSSTPTSFYHVRDGRQPRDPGE